MKRRFTWLLLIGLVFSLCFSCYKVDLAKVNPSQESTTASSLEQLYLPLHKDFRIVVISDLNSQYGSTTYEPEIKQAIALMPQWQPDLVLCGGDMIAGQKASLTKEQIKQMWAAFELQVAAPLKKYQIPFGFTIGNHDGSGAIKDQALIFERERDLAQAYWEQNQDQLGLNFVDRANFPFFYSFRQNEVFLLVWDASTQAISPQQLDWVQKMLNSPAAQQAKARIVVGHLPLYPVAKTKNQPGEYLADGEKLRSLLEQNQVDIYISGHHHAYYPGKKGSLQLLHAGALGQGARQLINSELPASKTITVVDLDLSRLQIAYTTYNAKTWELISLAQLPISIPSDYGKILRHDR